jgi:hypothetical protein
MNEHAAATHGRPIPLLARGTQVWHAH